jgi:hypothetical protein
MITEQEIENLQPGTKLIFIQDGGWPNTKVGSVYTFSNWYEGEHIHLGKRFWQAKEFLDEGTMQHAFIIFHTEVFNPGVATLQPISPNESSHR